MIDIATRLAHVRERIAECVRRRGPGPPVRLIGVGKRQPLAAVQAALAAGLDDLGENYAQALRDRIAFMGHDPPTWHFVGAIQSNKLKYLVGKAVIHTVDRRAILDAIEERAARLGLSQETLVEVNVGGEAHKAGTEPGEVAALLDRFAELEHVHCTGLMAIPPPAPPEEARAYFRTVRRLRDELAATRRKNVDLDELSMGMSADCEAAILEGATMVRIGTAVFGPRPPKEA